MKIILLLGTLFLSFNSFSKNYDLARRFGIAFAAGANRPILGNRFDDRAGGDFTFGAYATYQVNDESGFMLGYTRFDWAHCPTAIRLYDLMYLHRPKSESRFTPLWGIGAGLVDISNYNVDENLKLGLRARVGLEYGLSPDVLLAGVVDYQFVNKMIGEEDNLTIGEIHALAPQGILTFFFGQ